MKKALLAVTLIAAIVLSYALGRRHAWHDADNAGRRVLYWVDPMHPAYRSDKPGIAPDCGMQLEPVYADGAGAGGAAVSGANLPDGTVNIDTARQQLIGMRVVPVETGAGAQTLRLLGRVTVEDTRLYRVSSAVEGWVQDTFDESVGAAVKKGQRLAMFYSPDFIPFENAYLAATERDTSPTSEFGPRVQYSADRLRVLGMSERQIKKIGDSRQILNSVDVVSPTDGLIVARAISKGLRFERQTEFYQIADLSRVWVIAEAFENEAQYFRPGTVARITLPGQQKTFNARISNIQPEVDPATHTLKLRLEAENPRWALRPDMFVDIEVPVSMPSGLTVPADALIDSGLVQRVFVDRGNGYFEPRVVQVGWRFGDQVQITKGLQAGDRVVSAGTFLVDSESRLKTAGGSHGTPAGSGEVAMADHHGLSNSGVAKDPECGMEVDPVRAAAEGNTVLRDGKKYYFCSRDCRRKFEQGAQHVAANRDGSGND